MKVYRPKKKHPSKKHSSSLFESKIFRLFFLGMFLCFSLFIFLFYFPFFRITSFDVQGMIKTPECLQGVNSILSSMIGERFFLLKFKQAEKRILFSCPAARKARIKRRGIQKLTLFLKPRLAAAVLCFKKKGECFFADNLGIIFQETNEASSSVANIPLIFIDNDPPSKGKEGCPAEIIRKTAAIAKALKRAGEGVKFFSFSGRKRIDANTEGGWKIYFSSEGEINEALFKLAFILNKFIPPGKRAFLDYIDLRFSKAYYKWRSKN